MTGVEDGTAVTIEELREDLQSGRYFRATRVDTGVDCTNEVLAELIRSAVPEGDPTTLQLSNPLLRLMGEDDARG